MNKTNYIILALVLCFSIAFVASPLKSFSFDLEDGDDGGTTIDASSVVDTSDLQNAFNQFQQQYTEPEHSNIYTDTELIPEDVEINWGEPSSGVYPVEGPLYLGTPVEESTSPSPSPPPPPPPPPPPEPDPEPDPDPVTPPSPPSNGGGCTEDESPPAASPPPVSPPPASPPPVSPPPAWTPPASPPPTLPATEPCMIHYFELPERAWVGYPITGKWSASAWCDDCDVDCTPYPACVWKQDSIGTGFDEYKFTLSQSGIYNYTLTCYGPGGIDERTESATVEVLNLPWWREIIPVLPGFLRGIWR